ncbi:MAG TPA: hypothetical protein VJH37_01235 [Candidatus Nanoarchaeia archaeon]|nr:hypothetical protein [Candidatus Nanoarchaeia archaeon]
MSVGDIFEKSLSGVEEYVALATVDAEHYQQTNIDLVKFLTEVDETPGVYVTLNKPFSTMEDLFKKNSVNTDMIIFIDAVTRTTGGSTEKTNKCLFIGSPENLSDVSLAMDQAVRAIPGEKKFLFFDSLSTLLIYNKPITVAKFIHFLSGKMRMWRVKGIIISLEKESDKELLSELSQFCDIRLDL